MLKKYIKNTDGVAATEFALMAPILLLIMAGVFDYGMFINKNMRIENTARAAAEYVVQGGDPELISQDIILPSNLNLTEDTLDTVTVEDGYVCECMDGSVVDCVDETCGDDDYVRRFYEVTISLTYETIFPYPGIPDSINLSENVRLQLN